MNIVRTMDKVLIKGEDENYREYHVAFVREINNNYQFNEIGTGENIPLINKITSPVSAL
ncbi:hypothetical protein [Lysinibacillus fusiformis]